MKAKLINTNLKSVKTRFGEVTINIEKAINFRQGIVGMPDMQNFCLTTHPDPKHTFYNLLQSLDSDDLCFLTIVLAPEHYQSEDSLISLSDYNEAIEELEFDRNNITMILIATIHNNLANNNSTISVNLKAPILIDISKMEAVQYVFSSPRYPLRYFLD